MVPERLKEILHKKENDDLEDKQELRDGGGRSEVKEENQNDTDQTGED